jgi:dihydrofolate reductase
MIYDQIIGIGACDPRGVMGKNGHLPWHYQEEIQHFKNTIRNSPLIMGHTTFLTLPASYFEKRTTIIFSRQKHIPTYPNQHFVSSFEEFQSLQGHFKELYVIGGAQIYSLFIQANLLDACILTILTRIYEGDTFFPLALLESWKKQILKTTPDFTIYRYMKGTHAHKNS